MRCKKPCPGCGQPDKFRSADGVCSDCSDMIKAGVLATKLATKAARRRKELYWIAESPEKLPWLRAGHDPESSPEDSVEVRFRTAFHNLVLAAGREVGRQSNFITKANPLILQDGAEIFQVIELEMADDMAADFADIYEQMKRNADLCRRAGFAEGRNILTGLAAGTLAIQSANEEESERG